MEKASDYESGDSRFESWQGRNILSHTKIDFIPNIYCHYHFTSNSWPCGPMERASDCESGDSRFESWQGRNILSHTKIDFIPNIYCHYYADLKFGWPCGAMEKASDYESRGFQVRVLARS